MGAWSKKITITPEINVITNTTNIEKEEDPVKESVSKPVITEQDNLSDISFDENSGWGNMDSY